MMIFPHFPLILLALSISACGGGGGGGSVTTSNNTTGGNSQDLQASSGAGGRQLGSNNINPASDETPVISSFTVSWVAPTQREDGAPISLSDIAGYKVHTGSAPGFYTENTTVDGVDTTSKTFEDLAPGSYFVSVTTLDTEGRESKFSDEIEILIEN